ncbi:hypothetical protein ASPZODRAFT_16685 [Penicilliopsis zonata CBS 506.65]|uniref:Uncharacterized protein n=1 Tax=Penicilliopsis zonata CBS 506.65 TaxID=1073090 RepID=A0A1L9SG76_9EURO|nr:hypothetical protein ASPZODRAFT_16685 [Penicilliopsis zonata CBS 506.65]OJJ46087.1 hypothetical protein ASPZODRAFT_16685 [Penicilliopsis zonata CBS 506.65]
MSDPSIPQVTLEDLQAFQAEHFPGHATSLTSGYTYGQQSYEESYEETYEVDPDDDGLGYYEDGVKRTLTDEQIEIFRHSEIHALLREKQLKEEALAEEREREMDEKTNAATNATPVEQDKNRDSINETQLDQSQPGKNTRHQDAATHATTSGALDYGESGHGSSSSSKHHVFSRKLVSYED